MAGPASTVELDFVSRAPPPALGGLVERMSGFRTGPAPSLFVETAEVVIPVIFNVGRRWRMDIAGRAVEPRAGFVAGLVPGPVHVSCPGDADLIQLDLTPLGAARLFGPAAGELAGQVVDLDALDGIGGQLAAVEEQLRAANDWSARFAVVERFLQPAFVNEASEPVNAAWELLASGCSVAETARQIGWSTRYLSRRFKTQTGLRPVTAARMLRFQRATRMARGPVFNWAQVAHAAGYADQAHLIREFRELSGSTPTAWAARARPQANALEDGFRNLQSSSGGKR